MLITHLYRQAAHVASRYRAELAQGHSSRPLVGQRRSDQYDWYRALSTRQKLKTEAPVLESLVQYEQTIQAVQTTVMLRVPSEIVVLIVLNGQTTDTYCPDVLLLAVGANKSYARGVVFAPPRLVATEARIAASRAANAHHTCTRTH
jgi:hypothetical protein